MSLLAILILCPRQGTPCITSLATTEQWRGGSLVSTDGVPRRVSQRGVTMAVSLGMHTEILSNLCMHNDSQDGVMSP